MCLCSHTMPCGNLEAKNTQNLCLLPVKISMTQRVDIGKDSPNVKLGSYFRQTSFIRTA